jgi:hypothetical protein
MSPIQSWPTPPCVLPPFLPSFFAEGLHRVTSSTDPCTKHSMTSTLRICGYHISATRRTLSHPEWKFMKQVMLGDTFVRRAFRYLAGSMTIDVLRGIHDVGRSSPSNM